MMSSAGMFKAILARAVLSESMETTWRSKPGGGGRAHMVMVVTVTVVVERGVTVSSLICTLRIGADNAMMTLHVVAWGMMVHVGNDGARGE